MPTPETHEERHADEVANYDAACCCDFGCWVRDGEVLVLDGETYCLRHAGLQALAIVSDAAEGGNTTVRLLAEAREVLRIIDARARARVAGPAPRSHITTVLDPDGNEVEVSP